MRFQLTKPCGNCPFRTDVRPYLTRRRAEEIGDGITHGDKTFSCHKTNDYDRPDGEVETPDTQHCAGAMIMLEHMGQPNQMMRIMERIGHYDRTALKMDAPVYTDVGDFIDAQPR